MKYLTMLLAAGLLLATASVAAADTLTVPGDHETIQDAVDAAVEGDTIVVKKGKHDGEVFIDKDGLVLLGKGKPVIDGGGTDTAIVVFDATGVTIQGFVIENVGDAGIFLELCSDVTITKCQIRNSDEDGIRTEECDNLTISKNRFENIEVEGVALSDDDEGAGTSESIVEKNRFKNIGDDAIDISGDGNWILKNKIDGTGGGGIDLDAGTTNVVEKNKMKKVRGDGIESDASDTKLVKNKISKPGGDGIYLSTTGNYLEKNKISKAGDDGIELDAGENRLVKNKMSKCGGWDLEVNVFPDTNIYVKNKFKTKNEIVP